MSTSEEKRKITWQVVGFRNQCMEIEIVEQTHRCKLFTKYGDRFIASNGIKLQSCVGPDYEYSINTVFFRGRNTMYDNNKILIPYNKYENFKKAIMEYNQQ